MNRSEYCNEYTDGESEKTKRASIGHGSELPVADRRQVSHRRAVYRGTVRIYCNRCLDLLRAGSRKRCRIGYVDRPALGRQR